MPFVAVPTGSFSPQPMSCPSSLCLLCRIAFVWPEFVKRTPLQHLDFPPAGTTSPDGLGLNYRSRPDKCEAYLILDCCDPQHMAPARAEFWVEWTPLSLAMVVSRGSGRWSRLLVPMGMFTVRVKVCRCQPPFSVERQDSVFAEIMVCT